MRSRKIEALISREIKEIRISALDFKRFLFCFQLRLRQRQTCRGDHPDDRTGLNYTWNCSVQKKLDRFIIEKQISEFVKWSGFLLRELAIYVEIDSSRPSSWLTNDSLRRVVGTWRSGNSWCRSRRRSPIWRTRTPSWRPGSRMLPTSRGSMTFRLTWQPTR